MAKQENAVSESGTANDRMFGEMHRGDEMVNALEVAVAEASVVLAALEDTLVGQGHKSIEGGPDLMDPDFGEGFGVGMAAWTGSHNDRLEIVVAEVSGMGNRLQTLAIEYGADLSAPMGE